MGNKAQQNVNKDQNNPFILRNDLSKKQKDTILQNPQLKKCLQTKILCLDFKNKQYDQHYILSNIVSCNQLITIYINFQQWNSLFHLTIYPIKFKTLKKICITQSKIQTIDYLVKLNSPCLQQINFSRNLLVSVKPLRKVQGSLTVLNLSNNFIQSWADNYLYQINFSQQVDSLNLQESNDKLSDNSFDSIFKLNCKSITRINLSSKFRIKTTPEVILKLQNAYKGQINPFVWIKQ